MSKKDDASVRLWLFAAAAFFGLVILYFLGGKLFTRRAAPAPAAAAPRPAEDYDPEPTASPLPTAAVRMKIKRIEPRKYRREGQLPPPPSVR